MKKAVELPPQLQKDIEAICTSDIDMMIRKLSDLAYAGATTEQLRSVRKYIEPDYYNTWEVIKMLAQNSLGRIDFEEADVELPPEKRTFSFVPYQNLWFVAKTLIYFFNSGYFEEQKTKVKYGNPTLNFCDIGCGISRPMFIARAIGYHSCGIELEKRFIRIMRNFFGHEDIAELDLANIDDWEPKSTPHFIKNASVLFYYHIFRSYEQNYVFMEKFLGLVKSKKIILIDADGVMRGMKKFKDEVQIPKKMINILGDNAIYYLRIIERK